MRSTVSFDMSMAVLYCFVSVSRRELRFTVSDITVPESLSLSPTMPILAMPECMPIPMLRSLMCMASAVERSRTIAL